MQGANHYVQPPQRHPTRDQAASERMAQRLRVIGVRRLAQQPFEQWILVVSPRLVPGLIQPRSILAPRIEQIRIERDIALYRTRIFEWVLVAPHDVLGEAVFDLQSPVRGIAAQWTVGHVSGAAHQVHAHVLAGEVQHRREAGLFQHHRGVAIDHRDPVELGGHWPRIAPEREAVLRPRQRPLQIGTPRTADDRTLTLRRVASR